MSVSLSKRQQDVLDAIKVYIQKNGCPPSVKDICQAVGISSTNGAVKHLVALEKKGHISRQRGLARSIQVLSPDYSTGASLQLLLINSTDGLSRSSIREGASTTVHVDSSILGRVNPDLCYVVTVADDGMGSSGILSGDLVVVEEQQLDDIAGNTIVVVLSGGKTIVRRLERRNDLVRLLAEQPGFPTELADQSGANVVIGIACAVIRPIR